MASFINTNMVSLNTQNNLSKSQDALAQSIKRLSTGLRINSAKDDAAGLAISNRMDATIRGQTVAIRNTNDAVSFSQTADGALAQINNNLQRLRELAVQASNGTNSAGDRELLNTEFNQLQQEVVRIQNNTAFNGTNAMQANSVTVQIGAGTTQYDKIQINGIDLTKVTAATTTDAVVSNTLTRAQFDAAKAELSKGTAGAERASRLFFNETTGHAYEIVKTGKTLATATTDAAASSFAGQKGYIATVSNIDENNFIYNKTGGNWSWINGGDAAVEGTFVLDGNAPEKGNMTYKNFGGGEPNNLGNEDGVHIWGGGTWNDLSVNASIWSVVEYGGGTAIAAAGAVASVAQASTVGTSASTVAAFQVNDGASLTVLTGMLDSDGTQINRYLNTDGTSTNTSIPGTTTANTLRAGSLFYATFTAASASTDVAHTNASSYSAVTGAHMVSSESQKAQASDLQIYGNASGVNILTQADALSAIDSLDKAMLQVNVAQIQQGATQNRLQAIISTLTSSNESTINARSHIMDTDFAAETASMARAQILQQAGMAMLAQANTSNNGIMALMR